VEELLSKIEPRFLDLAMGVMQPLQLNKTNEICHNQEL
jgi:hypothetical protein